MWVLWTLALTLLAALAVGTAGAAGLARIILPDVWSKVSKRHRWHLVIALSALAVFLAGSANFLGFFAISFAIGGDAYGTEPEGGQFYVVSHGRRTEVSEEVWTFSYYHALCTWVGFLLATLALTVILSSRRLFGISNVAGSQPTSPLPPPPVRAAS